MIGECDTQLDDSEEVDVASECLVVVIGMVPERTDRTGYDAWKLGILQKCKDK